MDNVTALGNVLGLFKPQPRRFAESLENHPLTAGNYLEPNRDKRLPIQANQTRRLIMDLPLGFFKQRIWAPVSYTHLTLPTKRIV